jgi:hypothetical protein
MQDVTVKFAAEFESGGAAFQDGDAWRETVRILRAIADRIERAEGGDVQLPIFDVYGNRVGAYCLTVEEESEDDE